MKVEIKDVDEKKGLVRITYGDERWYFDPAKKAPGIPVYVARPSITWIAGYWYKGKEYLRWLVQHNTWEDVESGLAEAGSRGSKVHSAVELFFSGENVRHDTKVLNPETEKVEELTGQEYFMVKTFMEWWTEFKAQYDKIEILAVEKSYTFKGEPGMERGYGFTVDLVVAGTKEGKREVSIIDLKTGQNIWKAASIQLSGIYQGLLKEGVVPKESKLYTLQVGYKRNKFKKYKLTEHEYRFDRVKTAYDMWSDENVDAHPEQQEFPLELVLDLDGVVSPDGTVYREKVKEYKPKSKKT